MPNDPTNPVQLCALADLQVDVQQLSPDGSVEIPVLRRCIVDASDALQRCTERTFGASTATNAVYGRPYVAWGRDTLRVQLPTPRVQRVTALAWRTAPQAAWQAVDLALVEWDTAPPWSERSSLVRAWLPNPCGDGPLWVRISYAAGWLCDFPQTDTDPPASDPPPADLQAIARWWAQWYYRKKDAPYERTANPLLGTVTIPRAMPDDLRYAVERWKPVLLL